MGNSLLTHRVVLAVSGADRQSFLQGLVTNDVRRLDNDDVLYTALLTPQGKFLHAFFLYVQGDRYLLDCDRQHADVILKRLTMYRLRAKVALEKTDLRIAAVWGADADDVHDWRAKSEVCVTDPRLAQMGLRLVLSVQQAESFTQNEDAYETLRLSNAVPDEVKDLQAEKSFPLQFGFEDLHAVDFHKGCYVGQEVTARTKHRGSLRKIICGVQTEASTMPASGSALYRDGKAVGEMLSSFGAQGLALMQADAMMEPALLSDDAQGAAYLRPFVPSWFKIPLES